MSTMHEIEDAVRRLSPDDLAAFRLWFAEFDADASDRRFEQDVAVGRLDKLADTNGYQIQVTARGLDSKTSEGV